MFSISVIIRSIDRFYAQYYKTIFDLLKSRIAIEFILLAPGRISTLKSRLDLISIIISCSLG